MAVLGKIEKVYNIPKPVRVADEIEMENEQQLLDGSSDDNIHSTQESPQPVPTPA